MVKTLLSLCDYSGSWSRPYKMAGWRVVQIDSALNGSDVCDYQPDFDPDVVLAAPPCDCFCRPASRWWRGQDRSGKTAEHVQVFQACLRLCKLAKGCWALENPPGRHFKLMPDLEQPAWQFQPWEFGDAWTKQTYIWGTAVKPPPFGSRDIVPPMYRTPNGRLQGVIPRMSSSHKIRRHTTPPGFAKAFFEANQ